MMNMSQPLNMSQTLNTITTMNTSQTQPIKTPKIKNNYKNMMSELMKPLPKEDKPNIHLGGGIFSKLDKI